MDRKMPLKTPYSPPKSDSDSSQLPMRFSFARVLATTGGITAFAPTFGLGAWTFLHSDCGTSALGGLFSVVVLAPTFTSTTILIGYGVGYVVDELIRRW